MTRRWVLLAVALVFGLAADARAEPRTKTPAEKAQKSQKAAPTARVPLQIYLAKGGADACGQSCSEWIAVEGYFDQAAVGRVQAFLRRHGARKLPVYFHSPGGSGIAAMAIGRELRARGIVTGAGKTIPRACAAADQDACRAAKRSPQAVEAEWRPDATCSSACVYAMLGGAERRVPPSARLGVHAGRFRLTVIRKYADGRVEHLTEKQVPSLQKTRAAEFDAQLRRYIRDMGIDGTLFDTAAKIPHESIHYLSRNQIAAFGIDRREFMETPWIMITGAKDTPFVSKWLVEALGEGGKDYRASSILLSCAGPQRAEVRYWRSASGESNKPAAFSLTIGLRTIALIETGTLAKSDVFETGGALAGSRGSIEFEMLETAATGNSISVTESDPWNSAKRPRFFKLSTQGLAEHVKLLRDKCAPPAG